MNFYLHVQHETKEIHIFQIIFLTQMNFYLYVPGLRESLQHCSPAARKWRENEEMKRKWRENEEIERKWRENEEMSFSFHFLILFPFPHSLSISSFSVHFLILFLFPHFLFLSSQFPHFLFISSFSLLLLFARSLNLRSFSRVSRES